MGADPFTLRHGDINPSKKIVIAMAAMFIPKAKDRMELIKRYIELVLENDSGE